MPAIARFSRSAIYMYVDDHPPPHFHIRLRDGREVAVSLGEFTVLAGALDRRDMAEPMSWAVQNEHLLIEKWRDLNS